MIEAELGVRIDAVKAIVKPPVDIVPILTHKISYLSFRLEVNLFVLIYFPLVHFSSAQTRRRVKDNSSNSTSTQKQTHGRNRA